MKTENIKKITTEDYVGKVYNLEIEPSHPIYDDQFYIDADTGIVVHNCHPRDNIALRYLAERLDLGYDLFHAIMHSRDMQAKRMAKKLVSLANQYDLPIVIHGRAYKPYVPYTVGSYSELVGHFVQELGKTVNYADPLTGDVWAGKAVILMAHNPAVTYVGTGVEIRKDNFYFYVEPGSVILDPWRTIAKNIENVKVIHYGNTRLK